MTQHNINISINRSDSEDISENISHSVKFARSVFVWIISTVEVPIMILTLYALCLLLRSRNATSVFLMHLILSDLIQTLCQVIYATRSVDMILWESAFLYSVIVNVYFMACIASERYLLVAHPHWYKTHHSLKSSCFISLIIWLIPLTCAEINPPDVHFKDLPLSIACLVPYLITVVCFVGTWRGLSHAISLTAHKRRMILGSLFLVLLNYTFLFLPLFALLIFHQITADQLRFTPSFQKVIDFLLCLLFLNPLCDCLLYLFMRSDVADIMPSLHCCCRSDTQHISVRYTTRTTQPSS